MNKKLLTGIIAILALVLIYTQIGLYTVQPIGAIPDGITLVVWRNLNEPFFNSPDAMSIRVTGGVSLMSRAMAIAHVPKEKIVFRLPYMEFAYLASTDGNKFEK